MRYRNAMLIAILVGLALVLALAVTAFLSWPVPESRPVAPSSAPAVGTTIPVAEPEFVIAFSIPDEDFNDACELAAGGTLTVIAAGPEKTVASYRAPAARVFSPRPCRDNAIVIVATSRFLGTGRSAADAGTPPPEGRLGGFFGRLLTGRGCPIRISPFFGKTE